MLFLNPYHFIPVGETAKNGGEPKLPSAEDLRKADGDLGHLDHRAYMPGTHSGRILCSLEVESPLVVGGTHRRGPDGARDYTIVEPFMMEGEPAIPATSLRGMIGSVAEAASQSALRVLNDHRPLSYRVPMNRALSALGMIVEKKDGQGTPVRDEDGNTVFELLPLAMPTLEIEKQGKKDFVKIANAGPNTLDRWRQVFHDSMVLKVYIGDYREGGLPKSLLSPLSTGPDYYMKLSVSPKLSDIPSRDDMHRKARFVISQRPLGNEILGTSEYEALQRKGKNGGLVRGFVRVLGQRPGMPGGKKHELFIPFSKAHEARRRLELPRGVVERFYELANERSAVGDDDAFDRNSFLPFVPQGTIYDPEDVKDGACRVRLREGQIVYFDIDENKVVNALSYSSLWRDAPASSAGGAQVSNAGTHAFFHGIERSGRKGEFLPFNASRATITPAEALFGFVSAETRHAPPPQMKGPKEEDKPEHAYAGRVRFSAGRLSDNADRNDLFLAGDFEDSRKPGIRYVCLKILGSPKPPCPEFYFTAKEKAEAPAKANLDPAHHAPMGRKAYLHGSKDQVKAGFWTTSSDNNKNQKSAVRPLKVGTTFWFHIEFDNLTDHELELLCFSLRPTDKYRHRLGMGKSLGLGTVRIEPQGLFLIDRNRRYKDVSAIQSCRRYDAKGIDQQADNFSWPDRYEVERKAAADNMIEIAGLPSQRACTYAKWMKRQYPDTLQALTLLGDPCLVAQEVHTPLCQGQAYESETFKWFVANSKAKPPQRLSPLTASTEALPGLRRHQG